MNEIKITAAALFLLPSAYMEAETKVPNIIIILADDLGYGDVSAYGKKTVNTPNIDLLANGGVCFLNGYATSATSTPSRYALFTGMYPWKNPNAKILPGDAPLLIDKNQYTLPKMLKNAGYTTGAIGKWHLGMGNGNVDWNQKIYPGAKEVGFDYSCLIAATNDRVPTVYVENGKVVGLDPDDPIKVSYKQPLPGCMTALTNPENMNMKYSVGHNQALINGIPRIGYMSGGKNACWKDEDMADYFVDKVSDFIRSNKKSPFFLYYGLHQPHVPRVPHPRFAGSTTMGPRGDAIVEADWCVGELIECLKKNGLLENTLIIFSSDNGPVLDDGYQDEAVEKIGSHSPSGGLRGGKYSLYDAGTHVPFFVYWKNKIKPVISAPVVCQMDLFASLADLLGQVLPDGLDSRSYLKTFLGESTEGRKELIIEAQGRLALRTERYVLIPPYNGAEKNYAQIELGNLKNYGLFDLTEDREQKKNLADKKPELLHQLAGLFKELTLK